MPDGSPPSTDRFTRWMLAVSLAGWMLLGIGATAVILWTYVQVELHSPTTLDPRKP
jgi:hypothetical protein